MLNIRLIYMKYNVWFVSLTNICGRHWLLFTDGTIWIELLVRKHRVMEDHLTFCCWSVCPAQHSCSFRAVYQSGATRRCHSRRRSPRRSSHRTDPGPRRQYCALAGCKHSDRRLKLRSNKQKAKTHRGTSATCRKYNSRDYLTAVMHNSGKWQDYIQRLHSC